MNTTSSPLLYVRGTSVKGGAIFKTYVYMGQYKQKHKQSTEDFIGC